MNGRLSLRGFTPAGEPFELPDHLGFSASFEFSSPGGIQFVYPENGVNATLLSPNVEVVVLVDGAEVRDGRYIIHGITGSDDEDKLTSTYFGKSILSVLDGVLVLGSNPAAPVGASFVAKTPGYILQSLFSTAQTRGAMTGLTFATFGNITDSNGQAWSKTMTMEYKVGTKYTDVLRDMVDKGMIEIQIASKAIKVYNAGTMGVDRADENAAPQVVLRSGVDFSETPFSKNTDNYVSDAIVEGDNKTFAYRSAASTHPYGKQETYLSQGGTTDSGLLILTGDAVLDSYHRVRVENTRELIFTTETRFLPLLDYFVSDWILQATPGTVSKTGGTERVRVRMMTVQVDSNNMAKMTLVLNDKFVEYEIAQAIRVGALVQGSITSPSGAPTGSGDDTTIPNSPTVANISSTAYNNNDGTPLAVCTATLSGPTTNTDGSNCVDIAWYVIRWRYQDAAVPPNPGVWNVLQGERDTALSFSGLRPGATIAVQGLVIDSSNHLSSWSNSSTHVLSADLTPPPVPSTPVLTTRLGTLTIEWDGKGSANEAMPVDFFSVDVHLSTTSGFTPSASTKIGQLAGPGSLILTDLPYNIGQYCKLISNDRNGNASDPSAQASATVVPLVNTDLIGEVIKEANLEDNAVTGDKISIGAITGPKLAVGIYGDNLAPDPRFQNGGVGWEVSPGAYFTQDGIRNLLTPNQASIETDTTGLGAGNNCTVARSTSQARRGAASLAATVITTSASVIWGMSSGAGNVVPVVAGASYTATFSLRVQRSGNCITRVYWYKSDYSPSSSTYTTGSGGVATTADAWVDVAQTHTAPADAAYARVTCFIYTANAVAGDVHYLDCLGLWQGVGGIWAGGGERIEGVAGSGVLIWRGVPNMLSANVASVETDTSGFVAYGAETPTLTRDAAAASVGSYGLKRAETGTTAWNSLVEAVSTYTVVAERTYTAGFDVKAASGSRQYSFSIQWFDPSSLLHTDWWDFVPGSSWETKTFTATAPTGATLMRLQWYAIGGGAAGDVSLWDNFFVQQIPVYHGTPSVGVAQDLTSHRDSKVPVHGSSSFAVEIECRSDSGTNGTVLVGATCWKADGTLCASPWPNFSFYANGVIHATDYTKKTGTITVPSDAASIQMWVSLREDSTNGAFYVRGVSYRKQIEAGQIPTGAITETKIADDAITTPKIAANAVTAYEIASGSVTTDKLSVGLRTIGENSLPNGGFESIDVGWVLQETGTGFVCDWSIDDTVRASGTRSAKAVVTTGNTARVYSVNTHEWFVPVVPGQQWYLEGTYKGDAAATGWNARILPHFYDASGGYLSSPMLTDVAVTASWQTSSGIVTVPAGAAYMIWLMDFANSSGSTRTVWVDNAIAKRAVAGVTIEDNAITAGKIVAGTITADRLSVGIRMPSNAIPNGSFEDLGPDGQPVLINHPSYGEFDGTWVSDSSAGNFFSGSRSLKVTKGSMAASCIETVDVPVQGGEAWFMQTAAKADAVTSTITSYIDFYDATGTYIDEIIVTNGTAMSTSWTVYEAKGSAPAAARFMRAMVVINWGSGSTNAWVDNIVADRGVTGTVIKDGVITTNHVAALAITADKIAANTITANKIAAGTITTTELNSTAINGMTITGATFKTQVSGSNERLEIVGTTADIRFYTGNSNETQYGYIDMYSDAAPKDGTFLGLQFAPPKYSTATPPYITMWTGNYYSKMKLECGTRSIYLSSYENITLTGDVTCTGGITASAGTISAATLSASGVCGANRFETGYAPGDSNSFSCSNWFRSSGDTGWYNGTHGGGIRMTDGNYVRTYANKGLSSESGLLWSAGAAGVTSGTGNVAYLQSDGKFWRNTSSRRYKVNIQPLAFDKKALLSLPPITYYSKDLSEKFVESFEKDLNGFSDPYVDDMSPNKSEHDMPRRQVGFLAEDAHDLGLVELVTYTPEGEPDGFHYAQMTAYHQAIIKEHEERIADLERRLAATG